MVTKSTINLYFSQSGKLEGTIQHNTTVQFVKHFLAFVLIKALILVLQWIKDQYTSRHFLNLILRRQTPAEPKLDWDTSRKSYKLSTMEDHRGTFHREAFPGRYIEMDLEKLEYFQVTELGIRDIIGKCNSLKWRSKDEEMLTYSTE